MVNGTEKDCMADGFQRDGMADGTEMDCMAAIMQEDLLAAGIEEDCMASVKVQYMAASIQVGHKFDNLMSFGSLNHLQGRLALDVDPKLADTHFRCCH